MRIRVDIVDWVCYVMRRRRQLGEKESYWDGLDDMVLVPWTSVYAE